jgi:transcriptional regulator with XRE-family HTH domain
VRGIKASSLGEQLGSLGEFIAAQRRAAELSLRQLAEQTGVSNPYLSQIERGLRRPSAEVLQQLAKALRVSAETLYVRAGILDPAEHRATSVEMAVLADKAITERQKNVLIDIYRSFVGQNGSAADRSASSAGPTPGRSSSAKPNQPSDRSDSPATQDEAVDQSASSGDQRETAHSAAPRPRIRRNAKKAGAAGAPATPTTDQ